MLSTYEGVVQQGRIRLPAGLALPEGARVYVTVVPALDERAARRKANGWLGEHVGNMVMARQPTMVAHAKGRLVWRFGAFVGSLSSEPFGPIGYVEVDAESGQILTDVAEAERMAERGERREYVESPR
jgi:hypothetical protein